MKIPRLSALPAAVLLAAVAAAAPPGPSLVPPPLPAPQPPTAAPAPPPSAGQPRTVPAAEVIPDWQARWELARVLSYLHRYDESLAEYRKVLAARPDDPAVRQDYGQVLFWSGRADDAFAVLSQVPAAQLTPEARLALADLLVGRQAFDAAAQHYATHLKEAPGDQAVRFKLAELFSWQKRYDESLALYREILAARPDDAQVRRRFALVLLWSGRLDDAAAELRRTLPD